MTTNLASRVAAISIALLSVHIGAAAAPPATPPASRTVLVELFTSEGCSSCPPADALLQQLSGHRLASGELVVGLSEHVDYWNHLGWSDPFSSSTFTERQSAYSDRFGAGSVYTPEVVINGEREAVGSDRKAVLQAIQTSGAEASPLQIAIQSAEQHGSDLRIAFSARGRLPSGTADLYAVLADDTQTSHVGRGENAGRTLSHTAVARTFVRLCTFQPGEALTAHITLPPSNTPAPPRHLLLFAQASGAGRIFAVESRPVEQVRESAIALAQPSGR